MGKKTVKIIRLSYDCMAVPNIVYHSETDILSNLDFMRGTTFAHLYS